MSVPPNPGFRPEFRPGLSITRLAISSGTPFVGEGCAECAVSRMDLPVPEGVAAGPGRGFPCSSSLAGSSAENRIGRNRRRIARKEVKNCPKRRFGCAIPSAQMTAFGCRRRIEAHSALMIHYRSRPRLIPRHLPRAIRCRFSVNKRALNSAVECHLHTVLIFNTDRFQPPNNQALAGFPTKPLAAFCGISP